MATFYGSNATKRDNQAIKQLIGPGDKYGRLRVDYDFFTNAAAKSQNDVIKLMKLPPGARVVDVIVILSAALDVASGTVDVGWEANLVDTADDDGFLANVDVTAAATFSMLDDQGTRPGILKQFDPLGGETQVSLTVDHSGGWDGTSGTITVVIKYFTD